MTWKNVCFLQTRMPLSIAVNRKMATRELVFILIAGIFSPQWGNEAADLQICIDSFVVHADKIIRTQDSRALGAKYLSEAEVATREICLQLCCETPTCDVFVYEHKRTGSCYLFHCGDPQDFKCKFTQHRNYSSGVLMPATELESQIKLTKHEEELEQLSKKTGEILATARAETTAPPVSTTLKVPQPTKANATITRSECSRYQFECRSTRECIAIYNACDGVPQCPDGSDEGPELDCPTLAGATARPVGHKPMPIPNDIHVTPDIKKSYPQQPAAPYGPNDKQQESIQALEAQQQLLNQVKGFGREGEIGSENSAPWRAYGQPRKDESSRIFNHKGGLVPDGDSGNPYGNGDFSKVGQGYYNPYPPYNWPPRQRDDPRWMYPGPPPDYYYEETQMRARPAHQNSPPAAEPKTVKPSTPIPSAKPTEPEKTTLTKVDENASKTKDTVSVKKVIVESKPKTADPTPSGQQMVMNEDDVLVFDTEGENERPRGAILSLAFGMCIAAIMITLVGCRLRVVQRRLRRGGKNGYAHDADFLVNGMYL